MINNQHIVKSYDKKLNDLEESLLKMYQLTKNQLSKLYTYASQRDENLFVEIISGDNEINLIDKIIIDSSINILSLRSPVSYDLRFVFSSSHISRNMERIGDNVLNIANGIKKLNNTSQHINHKLLDMIHVIIEMLNSSEEILTKQLVADIDKAIAKDMIIDKLHEEILTLALSEMKNENQIENLHHYLLINRALERIGDHIVNICKHIYFIEKNQIYFNH